MTDYAKLAEMIASSRMNLKNSLAGRVSSSELLQKSILEQELAKEKAKKDLEERKKLKEKEEKDLLFEDVNRIIPQPQGAPVAVVPRRRGRPKGRPKTKNLDLATQEDLIEILEEETKKDAEEEKKLKQTDIRRFMRRKQEERNWEKILEEEERKDAEEEERKEAAPKKRGRKRGSKNKPKNKSLTSRLIREARESVNVGEGMKKNKKDKKKKEKPATFPLKIDKNRQKLVVELNLLMGSIKSGSSNKKMNNRAKQILKQLNK